MSQGFVEFLKQWDVEYIQEFDLSSISTMGVGGKAKYLVKPDNENRLIKALDFAIEKNLKYTVVGGMSNILPRDEYYNGVVISTSKLQSYCVAENVVTVGAGFKLSELIIKASKLGLGGAEALFGIPGSVGGAVYGNAGAYGYSISDFLKEARVYNPKTKEILNLSNENMLFSYRESCVKRSPLIILSASFCFEKKSEEQVKANFSKYLAMRKSSQPYGRRSLGSIFKRAGDIPTSRLIDEIGLKGYRVGGAQVSEKHAGFIINTGGATAKDVRDLILEIKRRLFLECGLSPEEEIQYM